MTESVRDIQQRIDAFFEANRVTRSDHLAALVETARRGVDTPAALSADEIKLVCLALLTQCAQMGIG